MALAGAAALMCVTAQAASADNATLGEGCYGGWFAFTLHATGDIPAGSSWTSSYSAASSIPGDYMVNSTSGAITVTQAGPHTAHLVSTATISAGTVVYLQPTGYPLTTKSSLNLNISGYGGSAHATFQTQDGESPNC
ncbi:hypothetical protein [Actinokineospora enzanensis]|uniref:hypothetical protein n=1 Tax=Actinokineospora enzanensis TaxID=155975 RepID=UPI000365FA44|nr:hypothetical protein [Actinokineospora enzanensis]